MNFIVFEGDRQELKDRAYQLLGMLTGDVPDTHGIAKGFFLSIGVAALGDIFDAFIVKSRGGTDAMGIQWPPLQKKTIAYGRRAGKGDPSLPRVSPYRPSLTRKQNDRWKAIFVALLNRYQASMGEEEAKRRAAATAWSILKSEGAKTKLELLGNRQVEILRDTGILLNSLTPGIYTGGSYTPADQNQFIEFNAGKVVIGTNVKYAATHNYGDESRNITRRQFFPDDGDQVPEEWWQNWLDTALDAVEQSSFLIFGNYGNMA